MQVIRTNRNLEGFYELLGPVFGSRIVNQETHDQFFDDPDKEWYCIPGKGAASVLGYTIRNFWAASDEYAGLLLLEITADSDRLNGIVPRCYEKAFQKAGFHTSAHRKNFMEVRYAKGKKY